MKSMKRRTFFSSLITGTAGMLLGSCEKTKQSVDEKIDALSGKIVSFSSFSFRYAEKIPAPACKQAEVLARGL